MQNILRKSIRFIEKRGVSWKTTFLQLKKLQNTCVFQKEQFMTGLRREKSLQEISTLKDYSNEMETNMFEMDAGAKKINETGVALHELSSTMRSAISQIGNEIDQFKV